jgi:hypothetical protein
MKKYEIHQSITMPTLSQYTAARKPRTDVDEVYRQNGFKIINLPYIFRDKFFIWLIRRFLTGLSFLYRVEKGSDVHIQYPATGSIRWIIKVLHFRSCKVTCFIHDVISLRLESDKVAIKEIHVFNLADELIVHSRAMAVKLKEMGAKPPMKILTLFDYMTSTSNLYYPSDIRSVVFAGDLRKSEFIAILTNEKKWDLRTYFYGVTDLNFKEHPNICYEGKFDPNNISQIKGAWGLVWDGDSLESCSASIGRYLKYNSSHKISLYLVSEKPIIIWSQSSIRSFVEEQEIGLVVDSLLDIPALLSEITETRYREYVENVKRISVKLKAGGFLSACLQS